MFLERLLIYYRQRRSRPNANEVPKTRLISNLTHLQNSMFAHRPLLQFIVVRPLPPVPLMDPNTIHITKEGSVKFVRFVRLGLQQVASDFSFLEVH